MRTLAFHPLASLFPSIEGAEFDELVARVRAHGVRELVVLCEGQILDGRNRYRPGGRGGRDLSEPRLTTATTRSAMSSRSISSAGTLTRPSAPWWRRGWPT
jgi:hypothetical protein